MCFQESASKKPKLFDFSWDAFSGDTVWRAGNENKNTGTKLYNMTKTALFIFIWLCLCFIAKIFFVLLVRWALQIYTWRSSLRRCSYTFARRETQEQRFFNPLNLSMDVFVHW